MHHLSVEMQNCVDACLRCHQACLGEAMGHCLEAGGEHVAPEHFRLMMACAEICRTAASFMLIQSPHHQQICEQCADICEECADDCEALGDMESCVDACRRCADSCRAMAG